jgi:hypothetical protein
MIRRAVALQIEASPPSPKPGDDVTFTLTLINAGAGHKIPTGDPDRHFTVEFAVQDDQGHTVKEQTATMGRWVLWQPVILEVYDNRLFPLASRAYTFQYRLPKDSTGMTLKTRVRYHILTDKQHDMLIRKYQLTGNDPYHFTLYERDVPLSSELTAVLAKEEPDHRLGCRVGDKVPG